MLGLWRNSLRNLGGPIREFVIMRGLLDPKERERDLYVRMWICKECKRTILVFVCRIYLGTSHEGRQSSWFWEVRISVNGATPHMPQSTVISNPYYGDHPPPPKKRPLISEAPL